MSHTDVLLFDPGVSQWRCGRAEEDGPDVILPGVPANNHEAWQKQVRAGIKALEADPRECAMIMSEPPGTSTGDRARRADFLFDLGLRSVHFAAGLVLAIYDVSFDTGMIIDVGESATYIFAICDGLSVLKAATRHPLKPSGAGAGVEQLPGVIDAIVRTLGTIDTSLHASLISNVALVGGGSMAADYPAQLERQLCEALSPAPWTPRVAASKQRRLSCWLGGTVFYSIPSGEARFLSREEYEQAPVPHSPSCILHMHCTGRSQPELWHVQCTCSGVCAVHTHCKCTARAGASRAAPPRRRARLPAHPRA